MKKLYIFILILISVSTISLANSDAVQFSIPKINSGHGETIKDVNISYIYNPNSIYRVKWYTNFITDVSRDILPIVYDIL
jgi:hypothetical protein